MGPRDLIFTVAMQPVLSREPTELKVVHLVLGMLGSRRAKFKRLLVSTEGDKYQEVLTAVCPRYVCGDDVTDTGIQCGSGWGESYNGCEL